MPDNKQDQQPTPKPGDIKPFGAGVTQDDANKAGTNADTDKSSPKTGGQGADVTRPTGKHDETVPGGLYNVDGVVRNANGDEVKGYKVDDSGAIVKA